MSYPAKQKHVSDIIQQTGVLLTELCHGHVAVENPKLQRTLSDVDSQLNGFLASYATLQTKCKGSRLSVAVLALAKSGKSTLLNALCGYDLLPSNNVPETASICRLVHDPSAKEPVLRELRGNRDDTETNVLHEATGLNAIKEYLEGINAAARRRPSSVTQEHELEVRLRMAALCGLPDQQQVALELIDTPGTNEAGEERLKHQVERLLATSVDAVLYVLDYTKLKTQEEAQVLQRLKEVNPALLERLSTRLFFVVNKVEEAELGLGLSLEETTHYVAELITMQMGTESFQLHPQQVLLVSSRNALLSRLHLLGRSSVRTESALRQIAFGQGAKSATCPQLLQAAELLLNQSGVPYLESCVLSFLYELAGSLKIQSLADDLSRLLQQLTNVFAAHQAALQTDDAELMANAKQLQATLQTTLPRFDEVQEQTQQVEGVVCDIVRQRMEHLKNHLYQRVCRALDTSNPEDDAIPMGRWASVWRAARSLFSSDPARKRDDAEKLLKDLHKEITDEMTKEVADFWGHLEVVLNEQQRVLFHQLNVHIGDLSRTIEDAVSEQLNLVLQPADLSLIPPSAEQFHFDLERLFTYSTRQRQREETVMEHLPCNSSLCHISNFFSTPCPACHSRRYSRLVEEYEVSPEKVQGFFLEAINSSVEASSRNVRSFVRSYICSQVEQARRQLREYGERFAATMIQALEVAQQGEEARQMALQRVTGSLERVNGLQRQVQQLLASLDSPASIEDPLEAPFPDGVMYGVAGGMEDPVSAPVPIPAPVAQSDASFLGAAATAGPVSGVVPESLTPMPLLCTPIQVPVPIAMPVPVAVTDCAIVSQGVASGQTDASEGNACQRTHHSSESEDFAREVLTSIGAVSRAPQQEVEDPYVREIRALAAGNGTTVSEVIDASDPIVTLMQRLGEEMQLYSEETTPPSPAPVHDVGQSAASNNQTMWRMSVRLMGSSEEEDEIFEEQCGAAVSEQTSKTLGEELQEESKEADKQVVNDRNAEKGTGQNTNLSVGQDAVSSVPQPVAPATPLDALLGELRLAGVGTVGEVVEGQGSSSGSAATLVAAEARGVDEPVSKAAAVASVMVESESSCTGPVSSNVTSLVGTHAGQMSSIPLSPRSADASAAVEAEEVRSLLEGHSAVSSGGSMDSSNADGWEVVQQVSDVEADAV